MTAYLISLIIDTYQAKTLTNQKDNIMTTYNETSRKAAEIFSQYFNNNNLGGKYTEVKIGNTTIIVDCDNDIHVFVNKTKIAFAGFYGDVESHSIEYYPQNKTHTDRVNAIKDIVMAY